jgi:hypothetical protein
MNTQLWQQITPKKYLSQSPDKLFSPYKLKNNSNKNENLITKLRQQISKQNKSPTKQTQ